jgi:hypothetical protein
MRHSLRQTPDQQSAISDQLPNMLKLTADCRELDAALEDATGDHAVWGRQGLNDDRRWRIARRIRDD